jgi:uncharacterized protein
MPDNSRREFLARAAVAAGAAAVAATSARAEEAMAQVTSDMTPEEIEKLLDLKPNATCGYVRVTYLSELQVPEGALPAPFAAKRPAGSALYFMVTPDEPVKLHHIMNDQLYHYYLGDPLEVLLLRNAGEKVIVGPDIRNGQRVQLFIPGGTFHTARVAGSRKWFLGASTEWPGVIPADVEIGNVDALATQFPDVAEDIRTFPAPVKN